MNKPYNSYSLTLRDRINKFNQDWRAGVKLTRLPDPAHRTNDTNKPNL
jgi:hypothetical protein